MNFEKVVFAFFIILALSLNVSFVVGDPANPAHHHLYELFAALTVSLICTILKFGDRTQFGSTVLASSLVADLHLIGAVLVWFFATQAGASGQDNPLSGAEMANITSLASGALLANTVSVLLLLIETVQIRK